ncbi:hypothetical protein [Actinomadura violacea]|uniref:Transposase n=1 Tax=Actinomadura violacea TaxID=2819934 RepID=A0ABS3S6A8_9ACTN|nr:hypothetical protein [Actinomadura violacea]MBO2464123.1 hypothetical protein [Actinomadura violacea]
MPDFSDELVNRLADTEEPAAALVAYGERSERIFDKKALNYLGERGYMVKATATAVLQRGVVNKPGEHPSKR